MAEESAIGIFYVTTPVYNEDVAADTRVHVTAHGKTPAARVSRCLTI